MSINYTNKYIKDSMAQLDNNKTVFAISDKMRRDLEKAIDLSDMDITRETHSTYWMYYKTKEK